MRSGRDEPLVGRLQERFVVEEVGLAHKWERAVEPEGKLGLGEDFDVQRVPLGADELEVTNCITIVPASLHTRSDKDALCAGRSPCDGHI